MENKAHRYIQENKVARKEKKPGQTRKENETKRMQQNATRKLDNEERKSPLQHTLPSFVVLLETHPTPKVEEKHLPGLKDVNAEKEKVWRSGLEDVNLVGLRYVIDKKSHPIRKLFWFSMICIGIALFCYQVHTSITTYYTYPTSISIDLSQEDTIPFPVVTICNENMISLKRLQSVGDTNLDEVVTAYGMTNKNQTTLNDLVNNISTTWSKTNAHLSWGSVLDQLSPTYGSLNNYSTGDQLVVFYQNNVEESGLEAFNNNTQYVRTEMGLCLQYNGAQLINTTSPGLTNGLLLALYINKSDSFLSPYSDGDGTRVSIHDSTELPQMTANGLSLEPGYSYRIVLDYQQVTRLPAPYSDCKDDPMYTYNQCIHDCQAQKVVKNCSCSLFDGRATDGDPDICNPYQYYTCAWIVAYGSFHPRDCPCPYQCNRVTYGYTKDEIQINHRTGTDFVKTIQTQENHSTQINYSDIILLYVYFSDMTMQTSTTSATMDAIALLNSLGGAFGLILGSTILTLLQFIDYALETFWKKSSRVVHTQGTKSQKGRV